MLSSLIAAALALTYLPGEGNFEVSVYQTTERLPFHEVLTTPFTPHAYTNRVAIDVDNAEVRGSFEGLGVSLTDASAWMLDHLSAERREALLEMVFSPTKGAGLKRVRLNIGSSDYATALYNYNETAGDVEMKHFDLSRDDNWVVPMAKAIKAVNQDVFFFAAPWSPPSWMKTTGNFVDGHFKDGMEEAYANYLAAYVREMSKRGIDVGAVTAQNEAALSTHGSYPSCIFSAEQEAKVAKLLHAKLKAEGRKTGVWLWDWDYHGADKRLKEQLKDQDLVKVLTGIAWHSYAPGEEKMWKLKKEFPQIPFYHTEMGPAQHDKKRTEYWWAKKMRDAFENGCEAFTGWNLCLDENGMPLTGPHLCMGLVTVDDEVCELTPSSQYHVFRHIGPFVKSGAKVLRAKGDFNGTNSMLFRNPDGEYVLVVASEGHSVKQGVNWEPRPSLYVKCQGEYKHLPLPYGTWSVTTLVFKRRAAVKNSEPTGCAEFKVELPRKSHGAVLYAADYGFSVSNEDNAAAINRALAECKARKASRLVLEPGTYKCFGPKGIELSGLSDFTLDGKGAVLVFWRKFPGDWDAKEGEYAVGSGPSVQVRDCTRTHVKDLVCDWDWKRHPLGFFARVANVKAEVDGESYVDFKLVGHERYPLYPDPVPVQLIQPMSDDLSGARMDGRGVRVYCETRGGAFGSKNEWIAPDTLRVWVWVAQPNRPHGADEALRFRKGLNRSVCSGFKVGETYNICHFYYGMSGINLSASKHLTLSNVRLWSCRGHGLGIGDGLEYLSLEGFRLAPPTEAEARAADVGWFGPRPYTSTSDGTHCGRSRGHMSFVDCEWTRNNDDCINFHDCSTIARREGERDLLIVNRLGARYFATEAGHRIELRQETYEPTGWMGEVVSVTGNVITVDRPLPSQSGRFFVVYDREYSTDNLLFRNCRFHHAAWARNLILANNVTLEGCRFDSFIGSPLRFQTCYTPNVWCEGMGATNIVVRGCTFENCADFYMVEGVSSQIFMGLRLPSHKGWPESRVALIPDEKLRKQYEEMVAAKGALDAKPYGKVVGSLLVEGNTFVNPRGVLVHAYNGDGVILRNNKVVFDDKAAYSLRKDAGKPTAGDAVNVRLLD